MERRDARRARAADEALAHARDSFNEPADTVLGVELQRPNLMQRVRGTIGLSGMAGVTLDRLEAALPFDRETIHNAVKRLRMGAYLVLMDGRAGELSTCVAGAHRPVDRRGRPLKSPTIR